MLTAVYSVAFVHRIGLGFHTEPLKAALGLSDTALGLLTGLAFAMPYALGGLLAGWLTDRGNRVRLLTVSTLVWSAATSALGLAGGFAQLFVARVLTGVGQAAVQPASTSLLADFFDRDARGRAYGLLVAATALGTAAAFGLGALSVAAGRVMGDWLGLEPWRAGLLMLGLLGLPAAAATWALQEPRRQERAGRQPSFAELLGFARRNAVPLSTLIGGVVFAFMAPYGQLAFMAALYSRKYGWSPEQLALVYGAVAIVAGAGGSLLGGWLLDRRRARRGCDAGWWLCLWGAFWSLAPGVAAPLLRSAEMSIACFAVAAVFSNWPAVGVLAVITDLAPNELRGQVTAVQTALVGAVSAGFGPVLLGAMTDRVFGSDAALDLSMATLFAACTVASTALLWAGRRAAAR